MLWSPPKFSDPYDNNDSSCDKKFRQYNRSSKHICFQGKTKVMFNKAYYKEYQIGAFLLQISCSIKHSQCDMADTFDDPGSHPLFYSDRGYQYASRQFKVKLGGIPCNAEYVLFRPLHYSGPIRASGAFSNPRYTISSNFIPLRNWR